MFNFEISNELEIELKKIFKKDKLRCEIIMKKIDQIINQDEFTIDHYKNMRYGLSDSKRVHIDKSFVLLFKVNRKDNFIYFYKLDHHDNIYE